MAYLILRFNYLFMRTSLSGNHYQTDENEGCENAGNNRCFHCL